MKKISYNPFDQILKGFLIVFWLIGVIFFFSAKLLLANEGSIQMVFSSGRAVIIEDKYDIARKRALEDALYLASIQGGAKVDGFSSIDSKTHLKENLVVNYDSTKPDGQFRKDVDSSKLLSILKDFKFTSLEEGIKKVYDNFSKRYNR